MRAEMGAVGGRGDRRKRLEVVVADVEE